MCLQALAAPLRSCACRRLRTFLLRFSRRPKRAADERWRQAGLVYSEKGNLTEVLCKPKLIAIKSRSLMALEQKEKELLGNG